MKDRPAFFVQAKVAVIFNPTARGEKARRALTRLGALGEDCVLMPTRSAGAARALGAEAVAARFDTIVAAGGDGTVNEVVNGVGDVPEGFKRVRLGVIPMGTINVFARDLRLPLDIERAWEVVRSGTEREIDLPLIRYRRGSEPRRRYFVQLAGAGLDARAIELVNWNLKKRVGFAAYIVAGFHALNELRRRPAPVTVSCGGHASSGSLALIGNSRFYGGPFSFFHRASTSDGMLDVRVFRRTDLLMAIRTGFGMATGRLHRLRSVDYMQGSEFEIRAASGPVPFEVDGELAGALPIEAMVGAEKLRIVSG